MIGLKRCSFHKPNGLGYIQWHAWAEDWAEELTLKGINQTQCAECLLWFFPAPGTEPDPGDYLNPINPPLSIENPEHRG